jgi:hypothetical protein
MHAKGIYQMPGILGHCYGSDLTNCLERKVLYGYLISKVDRKKRPFLQYPPSI